MNNYRIAVLGGGDLSLGPAVASALAGYQGERRLHIAFYDTHPDGAGLMAGLVSKLGYFVRVRPIAETVPSPEEALEGANAVILFPAFENLEIDIPALPVPTQGWPQPLKVASEPWFQFQLLRWANGEDEPLELMRENDRSPLQEFLDQALLNAG
ncbi:hypothetical protein BH11ARM2_BH11ARM2_30060 [soil metagenome]